MNVVDDPEDEVKASDVIDGRLMGTFLNIYTDA